MGYRDTKKASRTLFATAVAQGGYFTAMQAQAAGYDYPHLEYHVRARNFQRVGHGLYRLGEIPLSQHDDLIRLALWSRNRKDMPQAVISHDTALFLHDLSDILPPKTHLTVPPSFRKPQPKDCVLHKAALTPSEAEEREGFRITTPLRTLLDASASNIPQAHLENAVRDALDRGLVRRSALSVALKKHPQLQRLSACRSLVHNPG